MYKLHGASSSPFVRKVWIFLKEKGLEFEHRQLDPLDKTERFLAMNPAGRIPVLEEPAGNFIADSSVICDYLERVHPDPALIPADHRQRARALWLEEYADTALTTLCARIYWMFILIPARTGEPVDQQAVAEFKAEQFPGVFDYLESIAPDGDAIVNDHFSIADIALAAAVRLLDLAGDPLDAQRWPRFAAYYQRTISRPSARSIAEIDIATTEVWRTHGQRPADRPALNRSQRGGQPHSTGPHRRKAERDTGSACPGESPDHGPKENTQPAVSRLNWSSSWQKSLS